MKKLLFTVFMIGCSITETDVLADVAWDKYQQKKQAFEKIDFGRLEELRQQEQEEIDAYEKARKKKLKEKKQAEHEEQHPGEATIPLDNEEK